MLASIVSLALAVAASASPLYDYVHFDDGHYSYFDTGYVIPNTSGWTGHVLNVTSQKWLTANDSDRSIWTHQVLVVIPDNLKDKTHGFLYITGGRNGQSPPSTALDEDVLASALLAVQSGTIGATLWQVPNQPIVFPDDPQHRSRSEDAAVAYTWGEILKKNKGPYWALELPMAKAAVKAMDAVTDFAGKKAGTTLEKFLVSGASKRGWATWFTGAVDSRVMGIAPIVMDLLHFRKTVMHMYKAYGGFTFAFKDYCDVDITEYLTSPILDRITQIVDPIVYKENLTMPKLVIDSTGDEFFMPDDDHFWWGELPGETYRLMITNAEHSMATGVVPLITGLDAFYQSLIHKSTRPKISWTIEDGTGVIHLVSDTKPNQVVLRFASTISPKRRDFRLIQGNTPANPCDDGIPVHVFGDACLVPMIWVGEDVAPTHVDKDGYHYELSQPLPPSGWRAFLGELYFDGPEDTTYKFTTQVSIIPQTFPYPPCTNCTCTLV